ncbi:hypothetical protein N9N67_11350 [Bacteriovoracaceae bacterium]|nr:hypothetical protein [Bacteriovoracaceae bacterium]
MQQKSSVPLIQGNSSLNKIFLNFLLFLFITSLFLFGFYLSQYKFSNEKIHSIDQIGNILSRKNDVRLKRIDQIGWSYSEKEISSNSSMFIGADSSARFRIEGTEFFSDKENTIISFIKNAGSLEVRLLRGKVKVKKVRSRKKVTSRKLKIFRGNVQVKMAQINQQERSLEKLVPQGRAKNIQKRIVDDSTKRVSNVKIIRSDEIIKLESDKTLPSKLRLEVLSNPMSKKPLLVQEINSTGENLDISSLTKNGTYYVNLVREKRIIKKSKFVIDRIDLTKARLTEFKPLENAVLVQEEVKFQFKVTGYNQIYSRLYLQISKFIDFQEAKILLVESPFKGLKVKLDLNQVYYWKLLIKGRKSISSIEKELGHSSFKLGLAESFDIKEEAIAEEVPVKEEAIAEEVPVKEEAALENLPVIEEAGQEDLSIMKVTPSPQKTLSTKKRSSSKEKKLLPKPVKKDTQEATYSFE